MKYTIEGFRQDLLVELKLDCVDACLLRYIVDFYSTGKMSKIVNDGKEYFWLSYGSLIESMPILGINNNDSLRRRLKKFVECGLFEHYTKKEGGSFSCYRLTEKYLNLLTSVTVPIEGGYDSKVAWGTTQKSQQKISLLKKTSLLNINNNELFETFWNTYNKKVNKINTIKQWNKLSKEEQQKAISNIGEYRKTKSDDKYLKYPERYLSERVFDDEFKPTTKFKDYD